VLRAKRRHSFCEFRLAPLVLRQLQYVSCCFVVFVDIVCCAQESTFNSQATSTATGDGVVNRSPVESDDSALIYGLLIVVTIYVSILR
jgi:hypothetical protein